MKKTGFHLHGNYHGTHDLNELPKIENYTLQIVDQLEPNFLCGNSDNINFLSISQIWNWNYYANRMTFALWNVFHSFYHSSYSILHQPHKFRNLFLNRDTFCLIQSNLTVLKNVLNSIISNSNLVQKKHFRIKKIVKN